MNRYLLAVLPLAAGCFGNDYRFTTMAVTDPPRLLDGSASKLRVPARCPIYTPKGGDDDRPDPPFYPPVLFGCGIDSNGTAYGLVGGDTGDPLNPLAVIPGEREVGVFYAFDRSMRAHPPTVASLLGLDGAVPQIEAWAAPVNVMDPVDPMPESPGNTGRVPMHQPIEVVAVSASGMLLSFGQFDNTRTQVAFILRWGNWSPEPNVSWYSRFYVNGAPDLLH